MSEHVKKRTHYYLFRESLLRIVEEKTLSVVQRIGESDHFQNLSPTHIYKQLPPATLTKLVWKQEKNSWTLVKWNGEWKENFHFIKRNFEIKFVWDWHFHIQESYFVEWNIQRDRVFDLSKFFCIQEEAVVLSTLLSHRWRK